MLTRATIASSDALGQRQAAIAGLTPDFQLGMQHDDCLASWQDEMTTLQVERRTRRHDAPFFGPSDWIISFAQAALCITVVKVGV